jgi:aminoglycoside 6-adenylyltransferase
MRTETEMLDLIIDVAKDDERIRAVQMQGSRTNPYAPRDRFQDYDICYFVSDVDSFVRDHHWIDVFGKRLMLQFLEAGDGIYLYSMLFTDANRIDLVILPVGVFDRREDVNDGESDDNEAVWLLTKDDVFTPRPPATHEKYNIKPPLKCVYDDVCNRFWWHTQYAAKGMYRDELPYTMHYMNVLRDALFRMVEWYIGQRSDYSVSAGKHGKYFKKHLNHVHYDMLCKTYTDSNAIFIWDALFAMCDLFREMGLEVARYNAFAYPAKADENMVHYLNAICNRQKIQVY